MLADMTDPSAGRGRKRGPKPIYTREVTLAAGRELAGEVSEGDGGVEIGDVLPIQARAVLRRTYQLTHPHAGQGTEAAPTALYGHWPTNEGGLAAFLRDLLRELLTRTAAARPNEPIFDTYLRQDHSNWGSTQYDLLREPGPRAAIGTALALRAAPAAQREDRRVADEYAQSLEVFYQHLLEELASAAAGQVKADVGDVSMTAAVMAVVYDGLCLHALTHFDEDRERALWAAAFKPILDAYVQRHMLRKLNWELEIKVSSMPNKVEWMPIEHSDLPDNVESEVELYETTSVQAQYSQTASDLQAPNLLTEGAEDNGR